jgi:outer membrane protein assembly factor BamB
MPRITAPSGWSRRAAFAPGRLILALRDELRAYDTRTGSIAWTAQPAGDFDGLTVGAASGVVVATAVAGRERPRIEARDAAGGALLWQLAVAESGANRSALVADRHVVLLPASGHTRGVVRDLFTGRLVSRFELPTPAVGSADAEAWVERGLVMVPWFDEMRFQERNHVVAFDLARGALAWRLPFDLSEKRMLTGVIQQSERTFLRIGALPRDEDPLPPPRLAELSIDLGAATPLDAARLGPEDVVIGLPRDTRVRLPDGPLLVLSPRAARDGTPREARLRAIDPARGELWVVGLGLSFDDLRSSGTPQAVVGDSTVVVALPLYDGRQRPPDLRTILSVYDRATGAVRETRKIQRVDKRDEAQLHAFGEVLLVRRPKQLEILR